MARSEKLAAFLAIAALAIAADYHLAKLEAEVIRAESQRQLEQYKKSADHAWGKLADCMNGGTIGTVGARTVTCRGAVERRIKIAER